MSAHSTPPHEDPIRPHTFDGIAEYDKKMPNWWLMTFYISIVFGIFYWIATERFSDMTPQLSLQQKMEAIEAIRLASNTTLDNETLWKMSRNSAFVQAGRETYVSTCASCHGDDLKGGIGASLVSGEWLHGGTPMEIMHTAENGVLAKGMPAWGSVLGQKRIAEVVAFILNHHEAPAQ